MHQNEPISGHIISGRSILCDGSLHLCIPNSLSCIKIFSAAVHKICSGVHFAAKDFAFTKNHCAVCFYQRFLQLPTIGGCPLQFCPFCPRVLPSTLLAAQYRSQSVILNTHRDTPANYRRLCLLDRDSKTQLQALRLEGRVGEACSRKL